MNTIDTGNDPARDAAKAAAATIVGEFYSIRNRAYPAAATEAERRQLLAAKRVELDAKLEELWFQTTILLGEQGDIPSGDTPEDAIPIIWYKPLHDRNLYPPISMVDNEGKRFWLDIYDPKQTFDHPYQPGLRFTVGIDRSLYEVGVNKTFLKDRERRGTKTDEFRYVLELLEVSNLDGLDMDHVLDLQYGGRDVFENIWPFDLGANRSAGARQTHQVVTYRDPQSSQVRAVEAGHPSLIGKWFRVTSVEI